MAAFERRQTAVVNRRPDRQSGEGELIVRAQRYEADALADLFDKHYESVYRYLVRLVGDPASSEELARLVWLRVLAGLPRFRRFNTGFQAWLYRVADAVLSETSFSGPSSEPGLRAALRRLTPDQLDVLGLRYGAGMSVAEIALSTGRGRRRVEALQHRGLLGLRRDLAEAPPAQRLGDGVVMAEPSPAQLEDSLQRRADGAPVAEAAGLNPAAEELEALLALAEQISALNAGSPPAGARERDREEFLRTAEGHRAAWVHQHALPLRRGRHPLPSHGFRWTLVVGAAVFLALVAGISLALAAQLAEPGSSLYSLKLDTEAVLLAVNRSPTSKAAVHLQLASQRFRDTEAMAAKGKGDLAVSSMKAYYDQLRAAGRDLASSQHLAGWKTVRDQFDSAEAKPIDPIISELELNHQPDAATRVQALADSFAKDRTAIDAKLHLAAPSGAGGQPAPLPNGAPSQPAPSPSP